MFVVNLNGSDHTAADGNHFGIAKALAAGASDFVGHHDARRLLEIQ